MGSGRSYKVEMMAVKIPLTKDRSVLPMFLDECKISFLISKSQSQHTATIKAIMTRPLGLIMDLASDSLQGFFKENNLSQPSDLARVLEMLSQTVQGVQAVHLQQIIHRDIKADNFLVTENGVVQLCDFGLSRRATDKFQEAEKSKWAVQFVGPEMWLDRNNFSTKSDIYALGCCFWQIMARSTNIYHASEFNDLRETVIRGGTESDGKSCSCYFCRASVDVKSTQSNSSTPASEVDSSYASSEDIIRTLGKPAGEVDSSYASSEDIIGTLSVIPSSYADINEIPESASNAELTTKLGRVNGKRPAMLPPSICPRELMDLIARMWSQQPQDRPTLDEVTAELERILAMVREGTVTTTLVPTWSLLYSPK